MEKHLRPRESRSVKRLLSQATLLWSLGAVCIPSALVHSPSPWLHNSHRPVSPINRDLARRGQCVRKAVSLPLPI